ncbi:hypothetical protein CspHIS471_0701620 [Cutaneotrichosporon sp. HIS471]|nr:hypothetical protein CspHIS471_0701620 [Cutaneotrichosporon sp. HIS471]
MASPGEPSRLRPPVLPHSIPTPRFRLPLETPIGKIQPVFDGFGLADTSWTSDSSFATSAPRPRLPHKTPETKRRRREELYTPAPASANSSFAGPSTQFAPAPSAPSAPPPPPVSLALPAPLRLHHDDHFTRRLAESGRRVVLPPLPSEQYEDLDPALPQMHSAASTVSVVKKTGPSRAERARAAGIPILSARSSVRPPPRAPPPLQRAEPQPLKSRRNHLTMNDASSLTTTSSQCSPKFSVAIPEEPAAILTRTTVHYTPSSSSRGPSLGTSSAQHPSSLRHQALRRSGTDAPPHQATPLGPIRTATPDSTLSLASSATTVEGRPEHWDLSMATPTASSGSRRRRSTLDQVDSMPSSAKRERHESANERHENTDERRRSMAERIEGTLVPAEAAARLNDPTISGVNVSSLPTAEELQLRRKTSLIRSKPPLEGLPGRRTSRPTPELSEDDDSKERGGLLGFLTGLFLNPPAPPITVKAVPPPARSATNRSQPMTRRSKTSKQPSGDENRPVRAAPVRRTANRDAGSKPPPPSNEEAHQPAPHPMSQREPLGGARGANANADTAPTIRRKRKDPPSTNQPCLPVVTGSSTWSASRPIPNADRRAVSKPQAKLGGNSTRPGLQSTASCARPMSRVTPFVAQALARMPKPGEGVTTAAKPVSVRDHERARELAIRRAVFERAGKGEEGAKQTGASIYPSVPMTTSSVRTTSSGRVPGEATRRRAEAQALNKGRRDRKAAEEARLAAEEARIRAEIEAELDRQARRATVFRPNPLPDMYLRR